MTNKLSKAACNQLAQQMRMRGINGLTFKHHIGADRVMAHARVEG